VGLIPPSKRQRDESAIARFLEMEQPTGCPRTVTTNRLLQELHDTRDIILKTLNREAGQRKQEMDQRKEEYKELKASMES